MSGNACEAPQTRKITKLCTAFLIFHYNRDLYTNGHLLPDLIWRHSGLPRMFARKMISSKNYWELEAQIHTAYRHSLVLHGLSIKFAQTQRNGVQLARRPHSNIEILLQVMTCLCGANQMLVLLDIGGDWTTHLREDLLRPSYRVGRSSLVISMPTEADWNSGPKITIAVLLRKKIPTWKK